MTRRISFITIVGAALMLAAPAFGKGQLVPQWQQALEARSEALNAKYGLGQHNPAIRALEAAMDAVRLLATLWRAAREEAKIRVRQPLRRAICVAPAVDELEQFLRIVKLPA